MVVHQEKQKKNWKIPICTKNILGTNYNESNIEEDIDLNNQFQNKNLPSLLSPHQVVSKANVDNKFNDPYIKIKKNTAHVDFNDENPDNVKFVKINSLPAVRQRLTPKLEVDIAISKSVDEW